MAAVILNESCIRALIGQGEAADMAKHVRVSGQRQPGEFPIRADGRPDRFVVERTSPFADKESIPRWFHPRALFQPRLDELEFIGPQRVPGG